MKPPYQIVFVEQHKTGASQMSATMLASFVPPDFTVNFAILCDQPILLTSQSISALIAQHPTKNWRSVREINLPQLPPIDLMIGLVLPSDTEDFVKQMQNIGVEKNVGISAYWDLNHLAMDNPASFAEKLYNELEQRIALLVKSEF